MIKLIPSSVYREQYNELALSFSMSTGVEEESRCGECSTQSIVIEFN